VVSDRCVGQTGNRVSTPRRAEIWSSEIWVAKRKAFEDCEEW
jgi:hypothetical protein